MTPLRRKLTIALAVVLGIVALLAGAAVVLPPLLWGDGVDYSHVASIKTAPEYQDAALIEKAWALPVASAYRAEFESQRNPSFCGPTSMVDMLHSLHQQSDQATVLDGTQKKTVFGVVWGGMTLEELAGIARAKLKGDVSILRDLDLDGFRDEMRKSNDPTRRYVVNFNRGPLFARGGGHFSPVAGYLADQDLVFVLDVNKKYGPWLVKTERLWQAVNTNDRSTGKHRGLLRIENIPSD
ncbi:MAG: phytochelatin synthase family protein [Polyangiaceae bacterium]